MDRAIIAAVAVLLLPSPVVSIGHAKNGEDSSADSLLQKCTTTLTELDEEGRIETPDNMSTDGAINEACQCLVVLWQEEKEAARKAELKKKLSMLGEDESKNGNLLPMTLIEDMVEPEAQAGAAAIASGGSIADICQTGGKQLAS